MAADWFCKIGEKKYGPLNDKQIKTIVAKGQLKPEHLVRQGSEGPWVPAGRIKGLFPSGVAGNAQSHGKPPSATAKPLPKAAGKPGVPQAKAATLPTAAEAPAARRRHPPGTDAGRTSQAPRGDERRQSQYPGDADRRSSPQGEDRTERVEEGRTEKADHPALVLHRGRHDDRADRHYCRSHVQQA